MTKGEQALLVAGLSMDFPKVRTADIRDIVQNTVQTVAVPLADVPLALVEDRARAVLEARATRPPA